MRHDLEQQLFERAKRKVGFKIHLTVFVIATAAQWAIWAMTNRSYVWPIWPTLGWGVGILAHYFGVYHSRKLFSVEKEYQADLQKLRSGKQQKHISTEK